MYAIRNKKTGKWVYGTDRRSIPWRQSTSENTALLFCDKEFAEHEFLQRRCGKSYEIVKVALVEVPEKNKPFVKGDFMLDKRSWFSGICKACGYNVVVTQPDAKAFPYADYWWYCSNKKCKHHDQGQHTEDTEIPDWVAAE